jgi:hypothetical protein
MRSTCVCSNVCGHSMLGHTSAWHRFIHLRPSSATPQVLGIASYTSGPIHSMRGHHSMPTTCLCSNLCAHPAEACGGRSSRMVKAGVVEDARRGMRAVALAPGALRPPPPPHVRPPLTTPLLYHTQMRGGGREGGRERDLVWLFAFGVVVVRQECGQVVYLLQGIALADTYSRGVWQVVYLLQGTGAARYSLPRPPEETRPPPPISPFAPPPSPLSCPSNSARYRPFETQKKGGKGETKG